MPFPLECNLPILAQKFGAFGMVCRGVEKSKVVIVCETSRIEDIANVRSLTLGHLVQNRLVPYDKAKKKYRKSKLPLQCFVLQISCQE